jgi:hypothetical protein
MVGSDSFSCQSIRKRPLAGFPIVATPAAAPQADLPLYCLFAEPALKGEAMSSLKEFRCEICGMVSENPIHWFVIKCTDQELAVIKWGLPAATSPNARHFCGEAHAQTYISRWFESVCVPPQRVLKAI